MDKIEILGGSLVISRGGDVILSRPKEKVYYTEEELKRGILLIYDLSVLDRYKGKLYQNNKIANLINSENNTFTEESLRTFLVNSLGFKTASGGSEVITIENTAATGTVNLDLSTFDSAKLNLTGDTTLTVSNTPPTGKTKVISIVITTATGVETLTLPVSWNKFGNYDPSVRNKLTIEFSNFTTSGLEVDCFIN